MKKENSMKKLIALLLTAGMAINAFAGFGCNSCGCRKPAPAPCAKSCGTYNEEKQPTCRYWKSVQMTRPACKNVQVSYSCPTHTADGYKLVEDNNGDFDSNIPPTLDHLKKDTNSSMDMDNQ
jgi:hypothetical protein